LSVLYSQVALLLCDTISATPITYVRTRVCVCVCIYVYLYLYYFSVWPRG